MSSLSMSMPWARAEQALAPRPQEVAVAVEHDHGMLPAVEDIDTVLAVDGHRRDVAKFPAVGQLGPVLDRAIAMLAAAQHHRHCFLLWSADRQVRTHERTCGPRSGVMSLCHHRIFSAVSAVKQTPPAANPCIGGVRPLP
jgi:hypothetical protein